MININKVCSEFVNTVVVVSIAKQRNAECRKGVSSNNDRSWLNIDRQFLRVRI